MTVTHTFLCHEEDLPDGNSRGFDPWCDGRDTVFVVRQGKSVMAWRDDCPHIPGSPMAWRKDAYLNANRDRIVCHGHGAQFDIGSGQCLLGPCQGEALTPVPLFFRFDGSIEIRQLTPGDKS